MRFACRFLFVIALALTGLGCLDDAPRDNPLDPFSDGFRDEGRIAGRVEGLYPPFDGIDDVRVQLVPLETGLPELATRTVAGAFALGDVPSGRYAVVAASDGFRTATDTVAVEAGQQAGVVFRLDALPVVNAQSLHTVQIVRWFPEDPVFQLDVAVEASDPDAPDVVEHAALAIPTGPDTFDFVELDRIAEGRFERTFDDSELPGGVAGLLGKALRIQVVDASGGATLSEPVGLVRIIQQSPQLQSPIPNDTTGATPELVWRPSELPFAFTYWVDVYRVLPSLDAVLIERFEDIPPSQTRLTLAAPLDPGPYSWAIWVVDADGNRSRSKPNGFTVQ